jgi:hypothetical protein
VGGEKWPPAALRACRRRRGLPHAWHLQVWCLSFRRSGVCPASDMLQFLLPPVPQTSLHQFIVKKVKCHSGISIDIQLFDSHRQSSETIIWNANDKYSLFFFQIKRGAPPPN